MNIECIPNPHVLKSASITLDLGILARSPDLGFNWLRYRQIGINVSSLLFLEIQRIKDRALPRGMAFQ
jgi:hypothetical protein